MSPQERMAARAQLEALVEQAIEALDVLDGDPDLEDGDVDCCTAGDDDPATSDPLGVASRIGGCGDPMDEERDDGNYCLAEDRPAWLRA